MLLYAYTGTETADMGDGAHTAHVWYMGTSHPAYTKMGDLNAGAFWWETEVALTHTVW